jgi:hypothetical protein
MPSRDQVCGLGKPWHIEIGMVEIMSALAGVTRR